MGKTQGGCKGRGGNLCCMGKKGVTLNDFAYKVSQGNSGETGSR